MENYWSKYWSSLHKIDGLTEQGQIARTRAGQDISRGDWERTCGFVIDRLEVSAGDYILDACGGNGLFSRELLSLGARVKLVDISLDLVNVASRLTSSNFTFENDDLLSFLDVSDDEFDKILVYAALQYFSENQAVKLFKKLRERVRAGGIIYFGDILDIEKRAEFLDKGDRYRSYFHSLEEGTPLLGTWYSKDWLLQLAKHAGFSYSEVVSQPDYQIYSDFRFDLMIRA